MDQDEEVRVPEAAEDHTEDVPRGAPAERSYLELGARPREPGPNAQVAEEHPKGD